MTTATQRPLAFTEAGGGPPLVLLHAFPFDRTMWRPQLDGLADCARVVAVDLPGFGDSPLPGPLSIDGMADAVADFIEAAGLGTVVLGGLSMGGYVALAFARRHPAKLHGLILGATKAGPDDEKGNATRNEQLAAVRAGTDGPTIEPGLRKLLSPHTLSSREAVFDEVRTIRLRQRSETVAAALVALRDRPDANPGLAFVAVPTLVLVGADDAVTPPAVAAALAEQTPGAQLVTIPDAGHLSNLEDPHSFNAAVRGFLCGLPGA